MLTATFLPTECLTAPASYPAASGPNGSERPARDPRSPRDASGGPGLVCPRSRYLNPSARDRGQRCKSPQVLLSVSFSAYSTKTSRVSHMNQPWRSKRHVQCQTAGTSTALSVCRFPSAQHDDIAGCCCRDRKSGREPRPAIRLGMAELADWWGRLSRSATLRDLARSLRPIIKFSARGSLVLWSEEEARCLCCSTYCLMIANEAPPADAAK